MLELILEDIELNNCTSLLQNWDSGCSTKFSFKFPVFFRFKNLFFGAWARAWRGEFRSDPFLKKLKQFLLLLLFKSFICICCYVIQDSKNTKDAESQGASQRVQPGSLQKLFIQMKASEALKNSFQNPPNFPRFKTQFFWAMTYI